MIDMTIVELKQKVNELPEGGRLTIRDFGVFRKIKTPARTARNVKTGEPVQVPEKLRIKFKPAWIWGYVLNGGVVEEKTKKEKKKKEPAKKEATATPAATKDDSVKEAVPVTEDTSAPAAEPAAPAEQKTVIKKKIIVKKK